MKSRITITILAALLFGSVKAASPYLLPLRIWKADHHELPLLFYISGDGGFNRFSVSFCDSMNHAGYDVVALNARSYFWQKKTPEQTEADIRSCLLENLAGRPNQEVIFIGYSFGADVLPFVVNRMGNSVRLKCVFLMAPSTTTDFEIHWSDIMGNERKRDQDVVAEINRLTQEGLVIITGSDERHFPFKDLTLKKYTHVILPGGHHFDGNVGEVKAAVLRQL